MANTTPFNTFISGLPAAASVGSGDLLYVEQAGTSKQATASQVAKVSVPGGGATGTTLTKTGPSDFATAWKYGPAGTTFNVKDYGAKGDGATNDTTAINAAIAALNTAVQGNLYFPAGNYIIPAGALTAVTATGKIFGDANFSTTITSQSGTALLFQMTGTGNLEFQELTLNNTVVPGSSSIGVSQIGTGAIGFFNFTVIGFWTGVDLQQVSSALFYGCNFQDSKQYGLRARNLSNPDQGGVRILNSFAGTSGSNTCVSGIRLESGGDVQICNFTTFGNGVATGIDVTFANATNTVQLCNCSLENFTSHAVSLVNFKCASLTNIETLAGIGSTTAFHFDGLNQVQIDNISSLGGPAASVFYMDFSGTCSNVCLGTSITTNGGYNSGMITGLTGTGQNGLMNGLLTPVTGNLDVTTLLLFTGFLGSRYLVNNTTQGSPTVGQAVVGGDNGGANIRPVYYDGSAWRYG